MIQQSVNQLLSTAGIIGRLSPSFERRQEAKVALGKATAAQQGLSDIEKNLVNPEKQYTETELRDIQGRVAEHNRNIYDAKTMAIKGHPNYKYAKDGVAQLPKQEEYTAMLGNIEKGIADKRQQAMIRMASKAKAELSQNELFRKYYNQIMGGE